MLYVICGPTGAGKTEIACQIAKYFSCPIINADAFQIYKGMNIGTAKLEKDNPFYSNHYLLDIVEPNQTFSVKEYQDIFRSTIDDLLLKYKDVVICGGTGLYIKAALYDYSFEEQSNDDNSNFESTSNDELYAKLMELDEKSAQGIHPNNRKRVIRALNIALNQEITKSKNIDNQKHELIYQNVRFLMINPDRSKLYENINHRVDIMMGKGLVNEVKTLQKAYQLSLTAQQAIGYKEVISYLNGEYSLDECISLIKQRSRNYAKRQVTFFKHQFPLIEIFFDKDTLLKEVLK